jgi:hypothetical protein
MLPASHEPLKDDSAFSSFWFEWVITSSLSTTPNSIRRNRQLLLDIFPKTPIIERNTQPMSTHLLSTYVIVVLIISVLVLKDLIVVETAKVKVK